ncbi:tyrosine-protein phosphatase [uncultured Jatrophihabitans sp.]|uniref:tyrosine-protein phosphatase n=1 Tax=uncultured Jatrophihabitans sp. TaxID=1610747 RepID=UPI0035CB4E8B
MTSPRWIRLDGAENVRDLGGLPTVDGRRVQPGRLIRSDSLQQLSPADVRLLVDELHVRAVADLRTGVEVAAEGPGPMTAEPAVVVKHLSLFPEAGDTTDAVRADDESAPVVLPWQSRSDDASEDERRRGVAGVYLRYLDDRADSVLATLRLIAGTDGATIVHCAAGKDRTGVVVAFALAEVGVTREAIVADYAASGERIEAILRRLVARRTYANDLTDPDSGTDYDKHRPKAQSMQRWFDAMDEMHGGAPAWLRAHGWTDRDAAALRSRLLD